MEPSRAKSSIARGETGNGEFAESVALASNGRTALLGGALDKGSLGGAWAFVSGATVSEQAALGVAQKEAVLHASVNPNGEEVTSCVFEYGTTTAYGSTAECSPAKPGSGGSSRRRVLSVLSKLGINTTYHFRVAARNALGAELRDRYDLHPLATFASAETSEPATPAKATDGGSLSVEGSGGTGKVTIGPYGKDVGGLPLARSTGAYFQIYRSTAATFAQIVYKDCDLGGREGDLVERSRDRLGTDFGTRCRLQRIPDPLRHSHGHRKNQAEHRTAFRPRHVGGPAGGQEYGKCLPFKKGRFSDRRMRCARTKERQTQGLLRMVLPPRPTASRSSTAATEDDACQHGS